MFSTPSSAPAADTVAKDITLSNLKADVVEASKIALVLTVFWATWDPSCKQLLAILEKLARASKGAVKIARIDIDKVPQIAQQMGVQSVPSVFAFHKGRPVDGFAGVLPEAQIKTWIDEQLKAAGIISEEKAGLETAFAQATEYLAAGDIATARAIYADILDMEPANATAYAGLVRCLVEEGDVPEARKLLDAAPEVIVRDKALVPVRASIELAEQVREKQGSSADLEAVLEKDPTDHQARFDLALAYYASGRNQDAVDQLLEIVRRARTWNEDAARKQLVKFFEAFGMMDPLTIATRKRLSALLFS